MFRDLTYGLVQLIVGTFFILFLVTSLTFALPKTPLSTGADNMAFAQLVPQGWGFYSKNPRDDALNVYSFNDNYEGPQWPNNSLKNAFGLKREGRAQGIELGLLISNLPHDISWTSCTDPTCLEKGQPKAEINNPLDKPTICGEIGIAFEEKVPWAYANYEYAASKEMVKVDVKC